MDFSASLSAAAASRSGWTPGNLAPAAWYYAASQYVAINAGEVTLWADRSGNEAHIENSTPGTCPMWDPGGWNGRDSVRCVTGVNEFLGNSGALGSTLFSGSDVAFSVLATCEPLGLGSQLRSVWSWDDTAVVARSTCYITAGNLTGYRRRGDDGGEVDAAAAGVVPSAHVRLAWSFSGTTISSWVNATPGMVAAACNTNTCTFLRARLAEGPEAGADAFQGRFMEVVVLARAVTASDVQRYQAYSLREWGA